MVMDRTHSGAILFGLGLLLILYSVVSGGLSTGYGIEVPMVLLRVGVAFVVLGVATTALRAFTTANAVVVSAITLTVMFIVGVAVMYYDLGMTPPEYGTPLTTGRLIFNQLEITLALAPVPAGYIAGVLAVQDRLPIGVAFLLGAALVGWLGSSWMMVARGSAHGFTQVMMLVLTIAAVGLALIPLSLMRQLTDI